MEKIKKSILLPLFIVLVVLLGGTIFNAHYSIVSQFKAERLYHMGMAEKNFQASLAQDASLLEGCIGFLEDDPVIYKAWIAKDRQALQRYLEPIFNELKTKYRITHFYLHQKDKINFLRVHQPLRHGDYIGRFTLKEASEKQMTSWGVELGPLGTYTLRVVKPWVVNGQLLGYLELGEEINHVGRHLKKTLGIDIISLIYKDNLDRARWEEGLSMLGKASDWDRFSDFVISDQTITVPDELDKHLTKHCENQELFFFEFTIGETLYNGGFLPSYDASGNEVGDLIILLDVTNQKEILRKIWLRQSIIFILLGFGLYLLFWIYLSRFERLLASRHQALKTKIFEQVKSSEALRDSRERYQDLFESAYDLIQVMQPDGRLLYVNRSWREKIGFEDSEIPSLLLDDFVAESQATEFKRTLEEVFSSGLAKDIKTTFVSKDGKNVVLEGSATCKYEENLPVNARFIFHDVTEQKKLEEQLYQSQKIQAIGTLAGGIAHDFNNILTSILGYSEFLKEDIQPDTEAWANLQQVIQAGMRAKDLVKQILAFSRQTEQELIPTHVYPLVQEVLKLMRSSLPTNISIKQNIATDNTTVKANPSQIHQVILNLCNNAYHAMQYKGGVLTVELLPVKIPEKGHDLSNILRPGAYLILRVNDTGHGMNSTTIKRIFEPYFTTKERGRGTGLGLAMVHGIIEKHKGHISVQSEVDKGTTFQVYLPTISMNENHTFPKVTDILPRGNERVMVLDDEEAIVHFEELMLKGLGYRVVTFNDSLKALEAFTQNPQDFDLVMTDMSMPKMTGAELASRLLDIRPELPIILCTGHSDIIDEKTAKSIGIKEFLMKPMLSSTMAKLIRKVLDA